MRLAGMPGFDALKDEPWPSQSAPELPDDTPMFDLIARQDALVYHPYQSIDPVLRLLSEAADDPAVLTIKQTLYRVSDNSPIVRALIRAAERGKHITVLVELKARFDEARNIDWAERLEDAGAQVIYGVRGLKTHAKVCLIVRREAEGIRRYMHFGTGNYNERTARLYGDMGLFTCDDAYGADASAFFNAVTGYAQPMAFRKLEAAPLGLRARLLELIENEAERARQGQPGRIMAKMNSLADAALIDALYHASQAGVEILLNVRGICCLRPGVRGLSERITVISVVDRFLEHARIVWFGNGGKPRVFISSADWMPRNLDRRIELLVPVEDPRCIARVEEILAIHFADTAQAWRLRSDGVYERVDPAKGKKPRRSQQELYRRACEQAAAAKEKQGITFVPERPAPTR
jgi:polyphosphate kinase